MEMIIILFYRGIPLLDSEEVIHLFRFERVGVHVLIFKISIFQEILTTRFELSKMQ